MYAACSPTTKKEIPMQQTSHLVTCSPVPEGGFIATAHLTTEHMSEETIEAIYNEVICKIPKKHQHDFTWECTSPQSCLFTLRFRRGERTPIFEKVMYLMQILQCIDKDAALDMESFLMV